jgi:hypothetical protein
MILVNQLAILVSLAERISTDWDHNRQSAYEMASVDVDIAVDLPEEVLEYATRFQSSPTTGASYSLPIGILAKYALGQDIPPLIEGD